MVEFIQYRVTRLALAAIIFVVAIALVRLIRELDQKTLGTLQYLDSVVRNAYSHRAARLSPRLRVLDLNLTLDDRDPNLKQACASALDSLFAYGARAVVADMFFDPFIDTTGRALLLQAAQRHSQVAFAFKFSSKMEPALVAKLKVLSSHAVSYSVDLVGLVRNWPDRSSLGIELPAAGLAESAHLMGFAEVFPERDGSVQFYPLFQRLAGVDSVFAGLSVQAYRLWRQDQNEIEPLATWNLSDYLCHLESDGIFPDSDGRIRIHKIASPLQPSFTWRDIRDNHIEPAAVRDKLILIVNTLTETDDILTEHGFPQWGYHASVISQLFSHDGTDGAMNWLIWYLLAVLYGAWIWLRLWPSEINNHIVRHSTIFWAGALLLIYGLPFVLPVSMFVYHSPVSVGLFLSLILLTFEIVNRRVVALTRTDFADMHVVLDETAGGVVRLTIQQAPIRLGRSAIHELPSDSTEAWRNYQRLAYFEESDRPAMRLLGEQLFEFVMAGEVGNLLEASLENTTHADKMLRLKIRNEASNFDTLPFELLRDSGKDLGFFALNTHVSIVRDLTADPNRELTWELPIRLLIILASPKGFEYSPLDLEAEKRKIQDSARLLRRKGWLKTTILERASAKALEGLPHPRYDIIHFVGHGIISQESQSNCLVLEDANRAPELVNAELMGQKLRQYTPKLILLNACKTAEGTEHGVFLNIAHELQRATGAVVIAHQFAISDYGGIVFSDAFYKAFAETLSAELAVSRARQRIAGTTDTLPSDWASPVYFIQ